MALVFQYGSNLDVDRRDEGIVWGRGISSQDFLLQCDHNRVSQPAARSICEPLGRCRDSSRSGELDHG